MLALVILTLVKVTIPCALLSNQKVVTTWSDVTALGYLFHLSKTFFITITYMCIHISIFKSLSSFWAFNNFIQGCSWFTLEISPTKMSVSWLGWQWKISMDLLSAHQCSWIYRQIALELGGNTGVGYISKTIVKNIQRKDSWHSFIYGH